MVESARWELVWAHRDRLVAVARKRCVSREDAEDCASDAMLRCVEMADLDADRVAGLLVTLHRCADLHRERAKAARAAPRLVDPPLPDVAAGVCDRVEAAALLDWLPELAPRERQVLLARAGGQSRGGTADTLGMSVRAADCALARARAKLRARLRCAS